jgi:PAS domain S-box-containing protein
MPPRKEEAPGSAIIRQTLEGMILSWNEGAERLYGYAAGELVGRSVSLLTTHPRAKDLRHLLESIRQGQTIPRYGTVHQRKDGTPVPVVLTMWPVRDEGGAVVGASMIACPVTEASPGAGSSAWADDQGPLTELRYVTSHARCLLWHGTVIDWGPAAGGYQWNTQVFDEAAALAFMPLDLQLNERYTEAWYRHRLPEGQELTNRLSTEALNENRPSYSAEFGCRGRDDQVRWFDERVYVAPLPPPPGALGYWRVVGVAIDITERKRAEEELREASRAKDEFLAMLAHELRNPLGAIRNALEVIDRTRPEAPAHHRALEVARRQVQLQTRIVSDLLDVSRITRGSLQLQRERVEFGRLCRQVAEDFRPALQAAELTLALELPETPVPVVGDPARLTQVLANLLDNAIKFTEPGGEITVRVFRYSRVQVFRCSGVQADKDGLSLLPAPPEHLNTRSPEHANTDAAVISVRDTGIGIEPELLPQVFQVFTQAEQTLARSRGGLGLGLALVKGLMEQHGGGVSAHSLGIGSGATFTFWLPLAEELLPRTQPAAAVTRAATARRVLIIEDIQDAAETLRDLLALLGCEVEIARSGRTGVELARTMRPDVVLCDIGLPGMDGYQVAAALREDPLTTNARLIAVSGYGQEEDRRRSREAGFDHHLTKPVDCDELQRLLGVRAVRR